MINAIIFSKDRACQCDLTLRSLIENSGNLIDNITVLYTASTDEFDTGYYELRKLWKSSINFKRQGDFKENLVRLTHSLHPFTVYFTDDDIFYRKLKSKSSVYVITDPEFCCFSLRLGKNVVLDDPYRGVPATHPQFKNWHDNVLYWDWTKLPFHTNFSYPLSVDGHIFETNLLLKYIESFDYDNPNSFEGRLQQFNKQIPPKMACFNKSYIVNTPLNRVQETCTNMAGHYFPADQYALNEYFLKNYRINLQKMDFSNIIGCHQELQLVLTES